MVLVFSTVFFHCAWSPVLHNFELIGTWKLFQNILSRLIITRINFFVDQYRESLISQIFAWINFHESIDICENQSM